MTKVPTGVDPLPAQLAAAEPLAAADLDLEQVEGSLEANPKWQSLLRYLAEEYFKRGYFKRAHFAYGTLAACEPAAGIDLVGYARCQILLGERTDAVESLLRILETTDADRETREWARSKIKVLVATAAPPPPLEAAAGPPTAPEPGPLTAAADTPIVPTTAPVDPTTDRVVSTLERLGVITSHDVPNDQQIIGAQAKFQSDPTNPLLMDWYAFLLYSANRLPEAVQIYEQLVREHSPTASALYYLGNAHLKMSHLDKAVACWNRLRELEPSSPLVAKVGRTLQRLRVLRTRAVAPEPPPSTPAPTPENDPTDARNDGDDGSGMAEVEATLLANPNKPEVLDWAAFAYYTAGNLPRALACYQRALLIDDDNPPAYYYLGTIYCRLGTFDQATRYWRELLDRYPGHPLAAKARPKLELLGEPPH